MGYASEVRNIEKGTNIMIDEDKRNTQAQTALFQAQAEEACARADFWDAFKNLLHVVAKAVEKHGTKK